ncbi:MAG: hypothetical protein IJS88_06845 [Alphaproteobacteria bacterium]|nr:hypothetical protein [Alphaproteobacteria bacterium]
MSNKYIENGQIKELRISVLGPDIYQEDASCSIKELSIEEQISFIKKFLTLDENSQSEWVRFIQRYMLYMPLSDEAITVLFENINRADALALLLKVFNMQGYNEFQGKLLCIFMLHCNDLETILASFQLICLRGQEFSPAIYKLLNNLDNRLLKSNSIDLEFFAEAYLQSSGEALHLFKQV